MMKRNTNRGLTFIETIIWISVFTMAMGALTVSLLSFYRANTYTIEQAQAVSDARRGIEKTISALREATYASDGAYPIEAIDPAEITFYSDIDGDVFVEQLRFYIEGTELKQEMVEPAGNPLSYLGAGTQSTISRNVRNIDQAITTFHYYDTAGNEILDMNQVTDVRFITVDLVVNVSPERLPNELTIRSSATLRNLR